MTSQEHVALNRADPAAISTTVKEAVATALLGSIFQRLSGHGDQGSVITGNKPSRLLTSAFLMPANPDDDGLDDDTSPIRITASGFDFMILDASVGSVSTHPQLSVYVRVLPSVEELAAEGVGFRLTHDVDRAVRRQVRERARALWEEQREQVGDNRNHPDWIRQKRDIETDVYRQFNIYENSEVVAVGEEEQIQGGDDSSTVYEVRGFTVKPGDTVFPSEDVVRAERPLEKWLRLPVVCDEFVFQMEDPAGIDQAITESNAAISAAIENTLNLWLMPEDARASGSFIGYPRGRTFSPREIANWGETLSQISDQISTLDLTQRRELIAIPELDMQWAASIKPDWSDSSRRSVHIALENRSVPPRQHAADTDESIFQVVLKCRLPSVTHAPMRLDRVRSSYRFNRYLHYSALGFNCGVRDVIDGEFLELETDWMPKYGLPKIEPTTHGIDCTFGSLAKADKSIDAVSEIAAKLRTWIEELDIDVADGLPASEIEKIQRETTQFEEDLRAWDREASMIQRGIDLLRRSSGYDESDDRSVPFRAWLLMNETMSRLAQGRYDSWRLFQLAFILASLPSLVTRMPEFADGFDADTDEATTLLYFATGGGKSEAFFGLLVFGIFLDRMRGKLLGVTAMLRYPLRLLTVQQAQRAARVLAIAEVVRRENSIDGQPFSIGFWVGSGNTPNSHHAPGVSDIPYIDSEDRSEEQLRESDRKYRQVVSDWLKLPVCPFCSSNTGLRRTRSTNAALKEGVVGHICTSGSCSWNNFHDDLVPLPFYIVDTDIYSVAPTVLLGTIDKLALIGHSPGTIKRVLGMFGFVAWQDRLSGRFIDPSSQQFAEEYENLVRVKPVYRAVSYTHLTLPTIYSV